MERYSEETGQFSEKLRLRFPVAAACLSVFYAFYILILIIKVEIIMIIIIQ